MSVVTWPFRALWFALYYAWLLVMSNVTLLRDIFTPGSSMNAGIVAMPLRCETDLEITMIANLISLTPGTLTLAVHDEPPLIYVHGMYADSPDELRAELYDLEARMLAAMRPSGEVGEPPKAGGV